MELYMGPLSDVVDFEDPENETLKTVILWSHEMEEENENIIGK